MSFIAVAIGGAAVVGAGVSIAGSNKASKAARDAAATNNALQGQIYEQNRATLSPYVNAGIPATNAIQALLGLAPDRPATPDVPQFSFTGYGDDYYGGGYGGGYGGYFGPQFVQTGVTPGQPAQSGAAQQMAAFDRFRDSSGYKFRLAEGQKSVEAALGKRGLLDSGAGQKALANYGQNIGSGEFANYMGALQGQQNVGLGAASAQAGVGTGYANAVSNNNNQAANVAGNAALSNAGAINGILQSGVQAFGISQGLKSSYAAPAQPMWV